MARTKKVPVPPGASSPDPNKKDEVPEKINVYDVHAVKHKLDTAATEVVKSLGYEEDFLVSNVKITLGVIAVCFALYAQFGPGKFPSNWNNILYCVIGYVITSTILNLFCYVKEGNAFLITYPKEGEEFGLKMSSKMERFSDLYTLSIASADKMQQRSIKMETSVTHYFHEDGYLNDGKFRTDIEKLVKQYEQLSGKKQN